MRSSDDKGMEARAVRRPALWLCTGVATGLAAFAVETLLIGRSGDAVLAFDRSGNASAALAAARPALQSLLLRIAVAYAVFGGAYGLATAALASIAARTRAGFRLLWLADALAAALLLFWATAIDRPALFLDAPALASLVRSIARHGAPWQPAAALAVLLALHLVRVPRLRRASLAGAGALSLALLLPERRDRAPVGMQDPLVVLIGIDAFRPDRLEGAASRRRLAPNLERFLRDAVRFDRAYTPIAQTEPAWAALLAASWPWRTGVRHPLTADAEKAALPTFVSSFSAAGYRTTFVTDCSRFNWQGPASGFQTRVQPPRGALNFVLEKARYAILGVVPNDVLSRSLPEIADNRALAGYYDPLPYARRLADRLAAEAREGRLLFAYHDTVAHYPGDVSWPFYRAHPDAPLRMSYELPGSGPALPADRARREELYDELIAEADAQIGILLDRLRAEGRYDAAWIVIFSDHGDGFHAGLPGISRAIPVHGARLSDEENRILLAIKPPRGTGHAAGREVRDLVRLIDLGPTLLEAAGLPALPGADGVSLLPALRGAALPPLRLYAETGYTHVAPDALDAAHFSAGPRGFDAWRVREDGAVEMTSRAHALAMLEKDVGAYDGSGWLIRWRRGDGSIATRCEGECSPALASWLDANGGAGAGSGSAPLLPAPPVHARTIR